MKNRQFILLLLLFSNSILYSQSMQILAGVVIDAETNIGKRATINILWHDSISHSRSLYTDSNGRFSVTVPVTNQYQIITTSDSFLVNQLVHKSNKLGNSFLNIELRKPHKKPVPLWDDILFPHNSARIKDIKAVDQFIKYVQSNDSAEVEIIGWAIQSEKNSDLLAIKRAENVRLLLIPKIGPDRIKKLTHYVSVLTYLDPDNWNFRKVEFRILDQ